MDYVLYLAVLALLAVLGRLPLGVVFRLGAALGLLAWALLPRYRRLVRRNLEIAFGDRMTPREIRRTVRRHFARLGANLLSAPRLARMPEADVQARVAMTGLAHLRDSLARGRGVVLAINHIGNWELYAQLIGHIRESPVGVVFQPQRNKYLNRLIDRDRRRLGMETFDRRDGYIGAAGMIERGGVLAILIDQHAGDAGVWTPLFGKLASTSPLAATLAVRTGAPLVSVAIHTTGLARWHCIIEPPLEPAGRGVPELTWMLNRTLEKQITASPPDWFWVHNRWKTPKPRFLAGRRVKRGFYLPPGTDAAALDPFRLLVRSPNWLGDAVMSIPAVEACKQGRPDLRLTVLAPAKLAPLWRRVPAVDEVLALDPGESPWRLARRMRSRFDAAILFPQSLRSALEARALGIPRLAGYPGHGRRWLLGQTPKFTPESGGHHADRYLRLVAYCGAPEAAQTPAFPRRPRARDGQRPRIGVCPGAEYGPAKRWPAERFAAALRAFHERTPADWVLFGVAGDAPAGGAIVRACPFPIDDRIGRTTLDGLMDALAECDALLTNDTGTMHLAAFLGVPTVAVFGSTEPALTAPLGDFHEILRHPVECSPCFRRECPIDFRCMTRIGPDEAAAALHRVLGA
jgi:lipopolysaccharide heptosyltransferase II